MTHPNKGFIDKFLGKNLNLPNVDLNEKRKQRLDEYYVSKKEKAFLNQLLLEQSNKRKSNQIKLKNIYLKEEEKTKKVFDLQSDIQLTLENNLLSDANKLKKKPSLSEELKESLSSLAQRISSKPKESAPPIDSKPYTEKWLAEKQRKIQEREIEFDKVFESTLLNTKNLFAKMGSLLEQKSNTSNSSLESWTPQMTPYGMFFYNAETNQWMNTMGDVKNKLDEFLEAEALGYDSVSVDGGDTPSFAPIISPLPPFEINFFNSSGSCLSPLISYERTGNAYSYVMDPQTRIGYFEVVSENIPKYFQNISSTDYIANEVSGSTFGEVGGLLLEPQRTNYVHNSPLINPTNNVGFIENQWTYSATGPTYGYMPLGSLGWTAEAGFGYVRYGPDNGITQAFWMGFTCPNYQIGVNTPMLENTYFASEDCMYKPNFNETGWQTLRYKTGNYLDTSKPITVSFFVSCGRETQFNAATTPAFNRNLSVTFKAGNDIDDTLEYNLVWNVDLNTVAGNIIPLATSAGNTYWSSPNYGSNTCEPANNEIGSYWDDGVGNSDIYIDNIFTISSNDGNGEPASFGKAWKRLYFTFCRNNSVVSGGGPNQSLEISIRNSNQTFYNVFDGSLGIAIWGLQVEQGENPTSLIPTGNSPSTRGADIVKLQGLTHFIKNNENLFYVSSRRISQNATSKLFSSHVTNGETYTNVIKFYETEGTSGANYLSLGYYTASRGASIIQGSSKRWPSYAHQLINGTTSWEIVANSQNTSQGTTYIGTYIPYHQYSAPFPDNKGFEMNTNVLRYNVNDLYLTNCYLITYTFGAGDTGGISKRISGTTLSNINYAMLNPELKNTIGVARLQWFNGYTGDIEMQTMALTNPREWNYTNL